MFLFLSVFLLVFASPVAAQEKPVIGALAGVSGDPGQFWVGGHMELREVMSRVWFRPAAEIGAGDGLVLFSLDGEFVYHVKNSSPNWTPYVGLGPALVVQAFREGRGDSGVGAGINFVGGIREHKGLLAEIKIGAFDSPGFRVGIGWTW
jgi:hypothetical protein